MRMIPKIFQRDRMIEDAYMEGWNHGHGIACHNVPTLGKTVRTDASGKQTVDADNVRDIHRDLCFQAEENSRQYSPFEQTAHEYNSYGDGGYRIVFDHDDVSDEIYATEEEAIEQAKADGWEGTKILTVPSSEELWEAFECGIADAIDSDIESYSDYDYGIDEDENDENT